MNPIDDPLVKLAWAKINLDRLDTVVSSFEEGNCYTLLEEPDLENGLKVYQLTLAEQPPEFAALTGDVINNMRGALDHLVWAIARMATPTPYNRTCFPIYAERVTRWTNRRTGKAESRNNQKEVVRVCQSLPREAAHLVESFQPYARRNDPLTDPLYVLDALWSIDKHRTIIPVTSALRVPIFRPPASISYLDDGTVIFKVPPAFDPETNLKPNLTFRVAFPPTPPANARLLIPLLRECYETVIDDVLPAFQRFFPKDAPTDKWAVTMGVQQEPF